MAGKLSSHVRSNVIGYLALFVALSGTAWAATELEKNEVKSKHIKNAGVKTKDLANDAVTSSKVLNGSLLEEDFASGFPQGPPGEQGQQGERGLEGKEGTPGAPGSPAASMMSARLTGIPPLPADGFFRGYYGGITGLSAAADSSPPRRMLSPPVPVVARDLSVRLTSANPAGEARTVYVTDESNFTLNCLVPASGSTCSNTTDSWTVPASTQLVILVSSAAFTTPLPATDALVTWRATMP